MRLVLGPFVATQAAAGKPFTVQLPHPRAGTLWHVLLVRVEVPNYATGAIRADVFLENVKVAGTNQGQGDTCQPTAGGTEICTVFDGHNWAVTWAPTNVPGIVQGRVTLTVDQESRR